MNAVSDTPPRAKTEITVDSDWVTTFGAILVAILGCLSLVREIYRFMWGHLVAPAPIQKGFFGIFQLVSTAIVSIYLITSAAGITKRSLRIASILIGIDLAVQTVLSLFAIPPTIRRIVVISKSLMFQMGLIFLLFAIVRWLGSVIRRTPVIEGPGVQS